MHRHAVSVCYESIGLWVIIYITLVIFVFAVEFSVCNSHLQCGFGPGEKSLFAEPYLLCLFRDVFVCIESV